jgi:hypothetical protein
MGQRLCSESEIAKQSRRRRELKQAGGPGETGTRSGMRIGIRGIGTAQ